jgi:phosphatidylinositol glycan class S
MTGSNTIASLANASASSESGTKEKIGIGSSQDAPANAVTIASSKKEPPPEKPKDVFIRRSVIASFWAIIIFLGLPIWWKTTAIYRASLPLDQMMDWADGRV